jgi:hypothetical protein
MPEAPDREERHATPCRRPPWAVLGLVGCLAVSAGSAHAQIYTRRNANGVIEATNVPDEPDFRLTYPGKGTLIHSRGFRQAYAGQHDRDIEDAAAVYGVSSDLVRAVIGVESEFDAYAVSSKGAQGLMQLMPSTARRFGVGNAFDARQNIFGGVQYLRFLLDLFSGDLTLAIAAYNSGENAVLRYKGVPPYKETQGYVRKVQALLRGGLPQYWAQPPALLASTPGPTSYAPAGGIRRATPRGPARPSAPVAPRVYYKYRDNRGVLHVAHQPPPEGVLYTVLRAFD